MILDLPRVIATEQPNWTALEKTLDLLERDPNRKLTIQRQSVSMPYTSARPMRWHA